MTQMLTVLAILLASPFGGLAQSDTRPPNEPRLLSKPAAEYPDDALESNVAGEVVIEVEVDRKGKVKKARPLGGPPSLQKAAAKAARKARFEPATVAGQPVNGRASIVYKFDLASPACPHGSDEVYAPEEVTNKALILKKPEPGFTEKARANNRTGRVVLRAVLCRTGEVTDVEVVAWLPDGLTGRAIIAARQIRFRPATKDGRPVSQRVTIEYNFNIY